MRLRFVQDHTVQQSDGNGPVYKAGETYDFTGFVAETYARKYIRRGYAVEEPAGAAVTQPAAVAPEAAGSPPSEPPPAATEETNVPAARPERRGRRRSF